MRSIGQQTAWLLLLTILTGCIVQIVAKDYYQILKVKRTATDREIKRQFRKLALKYHPDKNKNANATVVFQSLTEAYDVLSDPDKRRLYDAQGHEAFKSARSQGTGDFSKFVFDAQKILKEFQDSLSQFNRKLRDEYAESFEHIRQSRQTFNSFFGDNDGADNQFDFGNFFNEKMDTLKSNLFRNTKKQQCKMVPRRQGNRMSMVKECV